MLEFLIDLKREGRSIVGYGAPAKGNTLLNYCGIGTDFLDYTVDLNPHKQGHLLPGSHIPIRAVEALRETRPDVVLILPWNLRDEIIEQHAYIREWGGRFAARAPGAAPAAVIFHATPLDGAFVVEQERRRDERGFFARTWAVEEFAARGLDTRVAHMNTSFNARAGTLRGLHFQAEPHGGGQARARDARRDLGRGRRPAPGLADATCAGTRSSSTPTAASRSSSRPAARTAS